ncbi:hypothetical protein CY34DRAFT_807960 [Suillus luteus UH-Slu-Lm8-n1]|uniref:Uncharacterized protein n=1 Tax=Suillus luteus UH-Slu-Lm8-n1 TaxID=930992 RepID=A0A0D0AZC9_9AGAM|nr:hypothetical protein CY34DRAFT_807960 [Suillus luteus UH-Slu-Lm8-n1]
MSSQTSTKQQKPAVTPIQTMRGHNGQVRGVVHLPRGRQIVTCSWYNYLRLWDLESGVHIGKGWKPKGETKAGVLNIALSPNGKPHLVTANMLKICQRNY